MSRNCGYCGSHRYFSAGLAIENNTLNALGHWTRAASGQPNLLAKAAQLLERHEAERPSPIDSVKTEYLILQNSLADPIGSMSWRWLHQVGVHHYENDWPEMLIVAAVIAPWEKSRRDRIVNRWFANRLRMAAASYPALFDRLDDLLLLGHVREPNAPSLGLPEAVSEAGKKELRRLRSHIASELLFQRPFAEEGTDMIAYQSFSATCHLRATMIQTALVRFHSQNGRFPAVISELVPEFLRALPDDPYCELPFRYRISNNDLIH